MGWRGAGGNGASDIGACYSPTSSAPISPSPKTWSQSTKRNPQAHTSSSAASSWSLAPSANGSSATPSPSSFSAPLAPSGSPSVQPCNPITMRMVRTWPILLLRLLRWDSLETRRGWSRRSLMRALRSFWCLWVRILEPRSGVGKWLIYWLIIGLVCLIFLICSLRTNIVFFVIFLSLVLAFSCLAGAYWNAALAYENPTNTAAAMRATKLTVVSSAFLLLPHTLFPV